MDQVAWDSFYPAISRNVERKQVDAFRWMARRAATDGHAYLAFVDADELIALSEPFAEIAGRFADASAITVPVREMWYAEGATTSEPFAATLALRKSSAPGASRGRAFGWRASFLRNGLMGYDVGKTIYRIPLAAGEISVHRPLSGSLAARSVNVRRVVRSCTSTAAASLRGTRSGPLASRAAPWRRGWARSAWRSSASSLMCCGSRPMSRRNSSVNSSRSTAKLKRCSRNKGLAERVDVRASIVGPLTLTPTTTPPAARELRGLPPLADRVDYQFALVCDNRFVRPTFATMTSVLSSIGDKGTVRFVVLGDRLDPAAIVRLRSLEHTAFDVEVRVHDVTADLDRDVGTEDAKRATFGRSYLIDYLPPQRTVYLDGDVLATRDFTELFELDLGEACLAGVPDSAALRLAADPALVPIEQRNRLMGITDGDPLEYLNGGVLVFDLENHDFRELALRARALVVMQGRALKQRDQDAINIAFSGSKQRLESTYNYMTQFYVSDRCLEGPLMQRKYAFADASLIHFSGRIKPWESADDEFYNGLYRRLVSEAEERLGVSCGFYFSKPAPLPRRSWATDRWAEALRASADRPEPAEPGDGHRIGGPMRYRCIPQRLARDVRPDAGGRPATRCPRGRDHPVRRLARTGRRRSGAPRPARNARGPQAALRSGPGPRCLRRCCSEARASRDGPVPMLTPDSHAPSVSSTSWRLAPPSATELLRAAGVDGQLEALSGGWLRGWYKPGSESSKEKVSLYIGDDLVSMKAPAIERKDLSADGQIRGFEFNVANLLKLGYASGDPEISVRVTRSNIPLPGTPLPVGDIKADLRYDAKRDEWVERSGYEAAVAELLEKLKTGRRGLHRMRRRVRRLRIRRPVRDRGWAHG